MPRDTINITSFDKGIIRKADPKDIPLSAASDSNNIDANAAYGKLQGIGDHTLYEATLGEDARRSAWIKTTDGKWNLVMSFLDAGTPKVKIIGDWYSGSRSSLVTAVNSGGYSFVVDNQTCRVASGNTSTDEPKWLGYIPYGHLGGAAHGWKALDTKLPTMGTISTAGDCDVWYVTPNAGTMAFDETRIYEYTVSVVCDFLQESPLSVVTPNYDPKTHGDANYVTVDVRINEIASLNPRVTGIKVYRRDYSIYDPNDVTLWRLFRTLDTTNTVATTEGGTTTSWTTVSTTDRKVELLDYNEPLGATYEAETGVAETLESTHMQYKLNCTLNNQHFVADCYHPDLPDAEYMMFRSKPYCYDIFDWTTPGEYLKLPFQPLAIMPFNGRIWAFDDNRLCRINPEGMFIEDITEGVGCFSQRSWVVTDYGAFWCDTKNAYWHDGNSIQPIADTIKTESSWHGFTTSHTRGSQDKTPMVAFSSAIDYVLFVFLDTANTETNVWAWHIPTKRWDKWEDFTNTGDEDTGIFVGRDGEVFIADGANVYQAFTYLGKSWTWTSKEIDCGDASQLKTFYLIRGRITNQSMISFRVNGTGSYTALTNGEETKIGGIWADGYTIQIKITSSNYSDTCESIGIVYRDMYGKR